MILGAIAGDIIGSRFEFDRGDKSKDFELFTNMNYFTDDTVMTLAVASALAQAGPDPKEEDVKNKLVIQLRAWANAYPNAGYGSMFRMWVHHPEMKAYNSYGNGSAMRVSFAGWAYPDLETTRKVARWTAEVTHNHPEGVKGAEATAAAIYLARNGYSKKDIKKYIEKEFKYNLHRSLKDIRKSYHHVEDCQHTVPEALTCFLEASDYEDAIRNVMFIGGDTDTLGAITGSIADAFYGIPPEISNKAQDYLDDNLKKMIPVVDSLITILQKEPKQREVPEQEERDDDR